MGAPVVDEAACDDQPGDHVGQVHGRAQQTKAGRLEPAWLPQGFRSNSVGRVDPGVEKSLF